MSEFLMDPEDMDRIVRARRLASKIGRPAAIWLNEAGTEVGGPLATFRPRKCRRGHVIPTLLAVGYLPRNR